MIKREQGLRRIKTASAADDDGHSLYFGPFFNKNRVEETLSGLKRFLRIDCNSLAEDAPCLNHSLGLCLGHCFQKEKRAEYERIIDRIIRLLQKQDETIFRDMEEEMKLASARLDFERAAGLKKTLDSLHSLVKKEEVARFTRANHKIVLAEALGEGTVKFFFIHRNKIVLKKKINVHQAAANIFWKNWPLSPRTVMPKTFPRPLLSEKKKWINRKSSSTICITGLAATLLLKMPGSLRKTGKH